MRRLSLRSQAKTKAGFTLIEVTLTLAISGLIFIGLVGGLSGSVARQRYTSQVDSFAEFLRNVYSEASNPQGNTEDGGNSMRQAIYGRLILFGRDETPGADPQQFAVDYSVLGAVDTVNASRNFNLASLSDAQINALSDQIQLHIKGDTYKEYAPMPNYQITDPEGRIADFAILIIRNLSGGNLRTYVYDCDRGGDYYCITKNGDSVHFNIGVDNTGDVETGVAGSDGDLIGEPLSLHGFREGAVNFCLVSGDARWAGGTRNIRMLAAGTNSGAVQIVDQDSEDNQCRGL